MPKLTCAGGGNCNPVECKQQDDVELSLGLSLNGRFGFEPERSVSNNNNINNSNNNNNNNNNKLFRASSVVTDLVNNNIPVDVELTLCSPITRTCSLPQEMEVEWWKRKELQSLRRSEAKRKRVEKLKNVVVGSNRSKPVKLLRFSSQGSIGSHESGGSSGVSDLDNNEPFAGTNKETNETDEHSNLNKVKSEPTIKPVKDCAYGETMPCVSTKEEGPDGKRIQGFLYKYGKGEEVRIVCLCHGNFLTPAEFVKHGGGGDVDHPLRHIVVTSLFR